MLPPSTHTFTLEQVAALRLAIADLYQIEDMTIGAPKQGFVRFRGQFLQDPAESFPEIKRRWAKEGCTPLLREEQEGVMLIAMPALFTAPPSNNWINLLLLIATILSTLYIGAVSETSSPTFHWSDLLLGIPFSLSIMLILGAHELGHYFAARYHKVAVTLPYFIPMPLSIIGTMGAFIRLKSPFVNRRAMLDVGVAGPLAGMVFALPILIIGLLQSEVVPMNPAGEYLLEGNSLLYAGIKFLIFGQFLPNGNIDVQLGPLAWAGWVGMLVTGLNLLPVAQLDGGHIIYVLLGKTAKLLYWPIIIALLLLGLLLAESGFQWAIWIGLLLLFGNRHAEPLDDVTPLDPRRRAIAIFALILFILVFVPIPITRISSTF